MTVVKTGWVAIAGVAFAFFPYGCKRQPAEAGTYDWVSGGEAGTLDGDASAQDGGVGGIGGAGQSGQGGRWVGAGAGATGGSARGGSGPAATGGSGGSGGASGSDGAGRGGAGSPSGGNGSGGQAGTAGAEIGLGGQAGEDGAAGAPPDECAVGTDTDGDGVTDVCDEDDDDDGYLDIDDWAPTDPFAPGGLVAPGTIVNDACVKDVLAKLALSGMTMPIHRELFPPDVNGYFVRGAGQGTILAADDGAPVGATTTGMEARVVVKGTDRFDSAVVDFSAGRPVGFGIGQGGWVRGRGADFTHFGGGGGLVLMFSARRSESGSWLDGYYLSILLPTTGIPHVTCPVGAGRYRFSDAPLTAKKPATELVHMCVDGGNGYVPTETWTRNGDACECTAGYQVSCLSP